MIPFITEAINALVATISALGYLGIALLMALESSIIPVPSELVIIPAGVLVAQGSMSALLVFLFALVGSLLGSLVSYALARSLGRKVIMHLIERYGSFLLLKPSSIATSERFFERHGEITIFSARLLPVIRHLISLPAGFARMSLTRFTLYTALGAGIWNAILLYLGVLFGENLPLIQENIHHITLWVILATAILILLYLVMHIRKKRFHKPFNHLAKS